MIEILNKYTRAVLYTSASAQDMAYAVIEAVKREANLYGADLYRADLYRADLCGANLRGADLYGADLRGADLYGADLYGVNLRGADLREADLREADLRWANLYRADLYRANLHGANLRGADLYGADLRGTDLRGTDGITPKVLQISGTQHQLIVRDYGKVSIGCKHETLEWWESHYRAVGRAEGYSADKIEEYGEHLAACRRFMEHYGLLVAPTETAETAKELLCPLCADGSHDLPLDTSRLFKCDCPCHGKQKEPTQ